jgi:hypothetical protein
MKLNKKILFPAVFTVFIAAVILIYVFSHKNKEAEIAINYDKLNVGETEGDDTSQNYWNTDESHMVAAAENGYYFMTNTGSYIMYFDIESNEVIPVCAKADCAHNTESCNAYVGDEKKVSGIYYYQGYLYYMPVKNGMAVLTRMDASGGDRKEIAELIPNEGNNNFIQLMFHGDCVYVYDCLSHIHSNEEYTEHIWEVSLNDGSKRSIYEITGVNLTVKNVKSFGDKLFFMVQQSWEEKKDDEIGIACAKSLGVFAYDYNTDTVETISENNINDYYIVPEENRFYYFVTGSGLYVSDLSAGAEKLLMKSTDTMDMCNLSYDGKYLYVTNAKWMSYLTFVLDRDETKCMVMTLDGEIVNEIECTDFLSLYFGDDRYMFAEIPEQNGFVCIDKSAIETAKEWTSVSETVIDLIDR